jgi:CDP-diacylglycerol--serine O-phosphatidyltransferase
MRLFTLPNLLTCANLLCGCIAILQLNAAQPNTLLVAAWLVILACIFDFFDGFAARILHQSSPIGKDLDSLADVVSFGVLPSFVLYYLFQNANINAHLPTYCGYFALLMPVFSALRLAKFNNDPRQTDSFVGVPTPTNAVLIVSLPLMQHYQPQGFFTTFYTHPYFLLLLMVIMPVLLIAELPLIALKFKHWAWAGNEFRYILVAFTLLNLLIFGFTAVPHIILFYVALSVIFSKIKVLK